MTERAPFPAEWGARVFEARLQVQYSTASPWYITDELITEVVLQIRIGTFRRANGNLFQRYHSDLFRCYVCNATVSGNPRIEGALPHLQLHRAQVGYVLDTSRTSPTSWDHTRTPTLEEVEEAHDRLQKETVLQAREYHDNFLIKLKERSREQ